MEHPPTRPSDVEAAVDVQLEAMTDAQTVAATRAILGTKLIAYIAGVTTTSALSTWVNEDAPIDHDCMTRLRNAFQIAAFLIGSGESHQMAQAWFQGANPALGDRSPARALRELEPDEALPALTRTAWTFVATG